MMGNDSVYSRETEPIACVSRSRYKCLGLCLERQEGKEGSEADRQTDG